MCPRVWWVPGGVILQMHTGQGVDVAHETGGRGFIAGAWNSDGVYRPVSGGGSEEGSGATQANTSPCQQCSSRPPQEVPGDYNGGI